MYRRCVKGRSKNPAVGIAGGYGVPSNEYKNRVYYYLYCSNKVTGIYELSLCKMADTGSPGKNPPEYPVISHMTYCKAAPGFIGWSYPY